MNPHFAALMRATVVRGRERWREKCSVEHSVECVSLICTQDARQTLSAPPSPGAYYNAQVGSPTCGGGLGRGVVRLATLSPTSHDPHPQPLPTRGRGAHRSRGKLWINTTGTRCSLALAAALAVGAAIPAGAQQTTPIGVSYQPALYWSLPYYIASEKGWWKEAGLEPQFSTFPSGAPQMAAAGSKSWDVGGTGSAPATLGAQRFDILTIGITNDESTGNALMTRKGETEAVRNRASPRASRCC